MKMMMHFLKQYKKECVLAPLFKMLEALLELFVPLVVARIIDQGIYAQDKTYIITRCLILFVLAAAGLAFSVTAQYFAAKSAVGAATAMRGKLFRHIQTFGYEEMDAAGSATLITRMTSDINQVQSGINMALRLFLRSPFVVLGAMVMAFSIDIEAALIFAVTVPLLAVVVFTVMAVTKPIYKKVQGSLDRILNITRENLSGVRVIRAFHQEQNEIDSFCAVNDELTGLQKFAGKISGLSNPLTFVIINVAIILLVYVGALRVDMGELSQGEVVALYNYMSQILVELVKFANLIVTITKALASMNRIGDVLHITPNMKEGQGSGLRIIQGEGSEQGDEPPIIEFQDVSFGYHANGELAIQHISFRVKRGETVGIIGGTGAGKSTLINLIPRFYDVTKGTIRIRGRNIKEYTFQELRSQISVVPQKAQLFAGTIRSNLMLGCPDATEEDLEEALEISQAAEFVNTKEKGLDFVVEQGGKNLSGGQKQRLTLARALVRKSEILIMDDSASALDYATDAKLRKAIREMKGKPTVFIVSQRASSILNADQIIVLDDGEMAGIGTHEELLTSCKVYQEIYETQFMKEN